MEAIYSSGFLAWLHQNLLASLLEYIFLASPPAESDSVEWNGMRNLLLISPLRGLKCSWSDGWCQGSTDLSLGWLVLRVDTFTGEGIEMGEGAKDNAGECTWKKRKGSQQRRREKEPLEGQ